MRYFDSENELFSKATQSGGQHLFLCALFVAPLPTLCMGGKLCFCSFRLLFPGAAAKKSKRLTKRFCTSTLFILWTTVKSPSEASSGRSTRPWRRNQQTAAMQRGHGGNREKVHKALSGQKGRVVIALIQTIKSFCTSPNSIIPRTCWEPIRHATILIEIKQCEHEL